ncbi:MAG: YeeE/YedE thiosulfate transporter family protein [Mycobacterium sp.]
MVVAFCIALMLAFVMGLAIQRGNVCMVVAFDDLIYRHSAVRLSTIVSTWLMVPGGLVLLYLMTGFSPEVKLFPVTVWSVVGGLLLGIGAVVGGACTMGVVARIGSGEYVFMVTIVGFAAGCLGAQVFGPAATIHAAAVPTTVSPHYPVPALVALVVVLAINVGLLLKGRHKGWQDFLHNAWDPRTATIVIATAILALVLIYDRPWEYAELLGDASRRALDGIAGGLAVFAALVIGAIVGGRTCTRAKLSGPLKGRTIRCFLGGLIMGIGFSLGPGSFGGLTFFGQPLLLPYAWVVMAAAYCAILVGLAYLRSTFGDWIKARRS